MTDKKSKHKPLVIIGSSGHAISVANVAISAGYVIKNFVDASKYGSTQLGIEIISDLNSIPNPKDYCYAIAIGDNWTRYQVYNQLKHKYGELVYPILIHSSATISVFANIGQGTIIMPQAVVGPRTSIGDFCILNTHSSIDHDCLMQNYCSLAPSATTGGNVYIGELSAVLIGAKISHKLNIGNNCIIGANSYLNKNTSNNQVFYGTPAKLIRTRESSDPYLI